MDSISTSFNSLEKIQSESTPKSKKKVLFSPTKEIKNFKDYFDSSDDLDTIDTIGMDTDDLIRDKHNRKSRKRKGDKSIDLISQKLTPTSVYEKLLDANIPYILSLYLQLIFNVVIVLLIVYFIIIFIKTIQNDINTKLELNISKSLQEISLCSKTYFRNKCNEKIPPILESQCNTWAKCMNKDPHLIGKSQITAEIFAEIINGFLKPISWKSLVFLILLIFGSLLLTNLAFSSYRHSNDVKINQLQETIRNQKQMIRSLNLAITKNSNSNFLGSQNQNYLNDLDNSSELSTTSPLIKKSLNYQ